MTRVVPYQLRSSIACAGFVCFIPLFDSIVFRPECLACATPLARRTTLLSKASRDMVEHKLASVNEQVPWLAKEVIRTSTCLAR